MARLVPPDVRAYVTGYALGTRVQDLGVEVKKGPTGARMVRNILADIESFVGPPNAPLAFHQLVLGFNELVNELDQILDADARREGLVMPRTLGGRTILQVYASIESRRDDLVHALKLVAEEMNAK